MKKYRKSKRYYYFRKQKLCGVAILAIAVLAAILSGGNITASLMLTPIGLYVIFTKEMVITDDYFYEMEAKKLNEEERP